MKTVKIRQLSIGEGMPKTCVPVVGQTMKEIQETLDRIKECRVFPDMLEFRADWLEENKLKQQAQQALMRIRQEFAKIPLLFTFRTLREGGRSELSYEQYKELVFEIAKSGLVDAVDIEAFSYTGGADGTLERETQEQELRKLVQEIRQQGCVVIGSNHDFYATPPKAELVNRLRRMYELGVDIAKIAVMPEGVPDVLELLSATEEASADPELCPVITMSMGGQGLVSRMAGELFGSSVTFASVGQASAPGQIELEQLQNILKVLHQAGASSL